MWPEVYPGDRRGIHCTHEVRQVGVLVLTKLVQ